MSLLQRWRAWRLSKRTAARRRACKRRIGHRYSSQLRGSDKFGSYTFRKCQECGDIADFVYTPNARTS